MVQTFHATVTQKENIYIAQCLEVDIFGEGATKEDALMDLRETLFTYFEELRPFIKIYLQTIET